jgi:hypothetical protein
MLLPPFFHSAQHHHSFAHPLTAIFLLWGAFSAHGLPFLCFFLQLTPFPLLQNYETHPTLAKKQ